MIVYVHQPASNSADLLAWPPLRVYSSESGATWRAVADLMYLRGEENYTWLYWNGESPVLVPYTLKRVEAKLPAAWFTRTHRHYLVNQRYMERIEMSHASVVLHLTTGVALPISRRRWSRLRREWAGGEGAELVEPESRPTRPAITSRLTLFPPEHNVLASILMQE